jgi:parallel beta-helix repeat protein
MKTLLTLIFLASSVLASATTYYISPSGNDSNSGTISSPFFTLNKAWTVVKAGDIIYARGGTYRFSTRQTLKGKNGTASDTIRIHAYPGERPVFTKSSSYTTPSWPNGLIYLVGDYTHWKNIEIAYYTQKTPAIWYGMAVFGSNHNKFERINSHHNGHGMAVRDESGSNLLLNCDFHHNYDPLTETGAYGNGDGLEVAYQTGSMENIIKGCRFWNNSDDGIDLWSNNGNVVIDNCWSWRNGYREDGVTTGGDGGGFKFGSTTTTSGTEFKRTVKNSISVYNRRMGFNQNAANVKFYFYNNIAYKNPEGFVFFAYDLPHIMRNNVSFSNSKDWNGTFTRAIRDHNSYNSSWQPTGPTVTTSDFISLDTAGISGPRQSNGNLPKINFMRLAPGSDLIDAGANVGTPFSGNAPDIGAVETVLASAVPVVTYVSSKIDNAAPEFVDVSYSATLAGILPSAASFTVRVNSVTRPISKLAITGQDVLITLSSAVVYGDIVSVGYTKPVTNPLQCVGATQAVTISDKPVVNGVEQKGTVTEEPQIPTNKKYSIYPNPVREYITISNPEPTEGQVVKIYDLNGKLCLEQQLATGTIIRLAVNLNKGIYIIKIMSGSILSHTQKLVVV